MKMHDRLLKLIIKVHQIRKLYPYMTIWEAKALAEKELDHENSKFFENGDGI